MTQDLFFSKYSIHTLFNLFHFLLFFRFFNPSLYSQENLTAFFQNKLKFKENTANKLSSIYIEYKDILLIGLWIVIIFHYSFLGLMTNNYLYLSSLSPTLNIGGDLPSTTFFHQIDLLKKQLLTLATNEEQRNLIIFCNETKERIYNIVQCVNEVKLPL